MGFLILFGLRRRWQGNADRRSMRTRIDIDAPVMIEHCPLHDRQTQTHAARLGRAKWRKNFLLHLRGNAAAIILDRHQHAAPALAVAKRFG